MIESNDNRRGTANLFVSSNIDDKRYLQFSDSMKKTISLLLIFILVILPSGCATHAVQKMNRPQPDTKYRFGINSIYSAYRSENNDLYICIAGSFDGKTALDKVVFVPLSFLDKPVDIANPIRITKRDDFIWLPLDEGNLQNIACPGGESGLSTIPVITSNSQDAQDKADSSLQKGIEHIYFSKKNNSTFEYYPYGALNIQQKIVVGISAEQTIKHEQGSAWILYPFAVVFDIVTFPIQFIIAIIELGKIIKMG